MEWDIVYSWVWLLCPTLHLQDSVVAWIASLNHMKLLIFNHFFDPHKLHFIVFNLIECSFSSHVEGHCPNSLWYVYMVYLDGNLGCIIGFVLCFPSTRYKKKMKYSWPLNNADHHKIENLSVTWVLYVDSQPWIKNNSWFLSNTGLNCMGPPIHRLKNFLNSVYKRMHAFQTHIVQGLTIVLEAVFLSTVWK